MNKTLSRLLILATTVPCALALLPACNKNCNYHEYVSENRREVYYCKEDDFEVKVFFSDRETPYLADGVKGEISTVCEVYYKCENNADEVLFEFENQTGEMNYSSVSNSFYLSFTNPAINASQMEITLTVDGKINNVIVKNVFEKGTIDWQKALDCVIEYDGEKFTSLTQGNRFWGEIGIRLIYDGDCYYYVSVCDREKHVKAYLVDGKSGRIITEKQSQAD